MTKNKKLRPIDKPLYRYWQALYMAFYSRKLYVDVIKRWKGLGLTYFFLLIAVASIPLSMRLSINLYHYFDQQFLVPFQNMPSMEIQDGHIHFNKPMPYFIKNKAKQVVGIIDTTGEYVGINDEHPHLSVLITRDTFYFRPPAFQPFVADADQIKFDQLQVESFNDITNGSFTGEEWIQSKPVRLLVWTVVLAVYPVLTLFLYGFFAMLLMMLTILGQVYALFLFKYKISYQQVARISMVASTPLITTYLILLASNRGLYGAGLTSTIIFALYFSYGILSAKRESKRMVLA